jgi:hypothetical protein
LLRSICWSSITSPLATVLAQVGDPVTAPIRRFYFHHSFPVDARHNAKIFRDRLAVWKESGIGTLIVGSPDINAIRVMAELAAE